MSFIQQCFHVCGQNKSNLSVLVGIGLEIIPDIAYLLSKRKKKKSLNFDVVRMKVTGNNMFIK